VTAQPSLWDAPRGLDRAAARHTRDIDRLIPLCLELAKRGDEITVADLREEAVARGLLTGQETGRRLSFLGAVMRSAGLRNTGQWRRSHIERSHGNLMRVWKL
jgi:hypothetical protein